MNSAKKSWYHPANFFLDFISCGAKSDVSKETNKQFLASYK